MKQFNVQTQVFDDLVVEQINMQVNIPIEIHQIINGKSVVTHIDTTNSMPVPRFSTHGEGWLYVPTEHVDVISASITGGGQVWMDEAGQIQCSGASPSPAHEFDSKKHEWVLNESKQAELDAQANQAAFDKAKTDKAAEINAKAQSYIDHATGADQLPAFEVQSWSIQGAEAKAWHADSTAPTPTLESIAKNRGVPLDALRAGAYKKTMLYEGLVAAVTGQCQKYNDLLRAAKTAEAVNAIIVVYGAA